MTFPGDDTGEEPTVIGRRPVGPTRNGGPRRPAGAGFSDFDRPVPPRGAGADRRGEAAGPGFAATRGEPAQALTVVPSGERPEHSEDVLVVPAAPLLLLVAHLRTSVDQADVVALRREIVGQLRQFEERAVEFGARGNDISAARYVLCSLLDETVMTTPWGGASDWSTNSLLLEFHSETWGGEKVFTILDQIRGEPTKYLALIKLIDLCILLGFEGRFRVVDNGRQQLDELRETLGRLLREHGRKAPDELSVAWRGIRASRSLRSYVPLWIVFALAGTMALATYGVMKWQVETALDPAESLLKSIAPMPDGKPADPAAGQRL